MLWVVLLVACCAMLMATGPSGAGDIKVHSSGRYFLDASGKPVFLIGCYCWASVAPDYYNDSPQRYVDMIIEGADHGVNYLRFSLGINALGGGGASYWEKDPTPTPFVYVDGRADLDQWNKVFWDGLVYHAKLAKKHHVMLHVCLFDGVDIRGGTEQHRWINSYWNVKNQVRDFFGDLDTNQDGNADERGEFYRVDDFKRNTGVGVYQRRVIDKALELAAPFDNVFYEIGNEMLSSDRAWNGAVIDYVKSKTGKAITQNGGQLAHNAGGFSDHGPDTPADVKKMCSSHVGQGMPFWLDPDGSRLMRASADDLRRAIWYSLAGGAAGWGGFGAVWSARFDPSSRVYLGKLADFIKKSKVRFWDMVPRHDLVSNPGVNSCIAKDGEEYLVYVLNDSSATVDLTALAGKAVCRVYDPKAGTWGPKLTVTGGGKQSFYRWGGTSAPSPLEKPPVGAGEDWVIHIVKQAGGKR